MPTSDLGRTLASIADHMIKEHSLSVWQATQILMKAATVHEKLHTDPVLGPTWAHSHG